MATPEQVVKDARADWESFAEACKERHKPDGLFGDCDNFGLNMFVVDFFRHCVRKHISLEAVGQVVFHKLSDDTDHPDNRPASWLCVDDQGLPLIAVDAEFVRNGVALANVDRTITRIVLHEVGHVVRHWDVLSKQVKHPGLPQVAASSPDQEREAWWYAGAVVGFALGDVAHEQRTADGCDRAWLHS